MPATLPRSGTLRLLGEGRVGETLELQGEIGADQPSQWLRDGMPIRGATARSYKVLEADDGADLTCAIGHGSRRAGNVQIAPARPVRSAPPRVTNTLFDEILDQDSGTFELDPNDLFEGLAMRFSVSGPGLRLSADGSIVMIDTHDELSGADVAIEARNSGGVARVAFRLTVEPVAPGEGHVTQEMWRLSADGAGIDILELPRAGREPVRALEIAFGTTPSAPVRLPARTGRIALDLPPGPVWLRAVLDRGHGPWCRSRAEGAAEAVCVEPSRIRGRRFQPGETLLADPGVIQGAGPQGPTMRWLRDGVEIPGATEVTYRLQPLDVGAHLQFELVAGSAIDSVDLPEISAADPRWETRFETQADVDAWSTNDRRTTLSLQEPDAGLPTAAGQMAMEVIGDTRSKNYPEAFLDFEVEPETRYRFEIDLAGKTHGTLTRFRAGTPGDPSANTKADNGRDYWGKSGGTYSGRFGASFETAPGQRLVRLSVAMPPQPGAVTTLEGVALENLDAGPGPLPIQGKGGVQAQPEDAAVYFIDYRDGDNSADGLSPETAFRTAPWVFIPPGSELIFKGGVRYREPITLGNDGTPDLPITFDLTGERFGSGPAVLDGSQILQGLAPVETDGNRLVGPWPQGQNPLSAGIYQGDVKLALCQLPTPSDLQFPSMTSEYFRAEEMTATRVTSSEFAALHAVEDLTKNTWLRLWGGANALADIRIAAFDGVDTVTLAAPFKPYKEADRWRFAVLNHPAGLRQPGQFRQTEDQAGIELIRLGGTKSGEEVSFIGGQANAILRGSHVRWLGGIIEKTGGPGLGVASADGQRLFDVRLRGVRLRDVSSAQAAIQLERVEGGQVVDCEVADCALGGIRLESCSGIVVRNNTVDRCVSTLLGLYYRTNHCEVIGNRIGNRTGKHGNGMTAYWGCHDLTFAFSSIRSLESGLIGLTSQNLGQGPGTTGLRVVFNEFVTSVTSIGMWGSKFSVADWPDEGRNFIANNIFYNPPGSSQYGVFFQRPETAMDTTLINNIASAISDPQGGLLDQRRQTAYGIEALSIVAGGQGYAEGDELGVPDWGGDNRIKVTSVDGQGAILGLRVMGSRNALEPPAQPNDMALGGGSGRGARIAVTLRPTNLKLRSHNVYIGDRPKYRMETGRMRVFGDLPGWQTSRRIPYFADVTSPDLQDWDLRPGEAKLGGGYPWRFELPHERFPDFPEAGIEVSHIGRYLPDGSDVWDWRGS